MKYAFSMLFVAGNAVAGSFIGEADVIGIEPNWIMQSMPKQVCSMVSTPVQVTYPGQVIHRKTDTGKLILNTALGAAIGHQFGKGKGRDAATVFGGLVGYGSTNDDIVTSGSYTTTEYRQTEKCSTVYESQRVQSGYIVKYNYNGYVGMMHSNVYPGSTINVNITVGE
jgi:uncharacterized protein YcfJ